MFATASVSEGEASCANASAGAAARASIIRTCRMRRVSHTVLYSGDEGAAQARLPRVVLGRGAVPAVFRQGVSRWHGAACSSAAHGGAPLRRFGRRSGLLPAPPRRRHVATEGAVRCAGLLPRLPWRAGLGARRG